MLNIIINNKSMKLSDTTITKTLNGRGNTKKNESSRRVPNLQSVKVEKSSKGKSSPQSDTKSVKEHKEPLRKSRRSTNPDEKAIKERSRSRDYQKPWIPCTRRPSNPKPPPALIDTELSSADSKQVYKKFPNSPTPDSSDTEKCKRTQNTKVVKDKNGHQSKTSISDTSSTKRPKGALKRQLALDDPPSNLKDTFSVSDESLNSITSVTQLLKIERSQYSLNGSSNNSAHDNDFDEEEIVTGGVKSLAARWQARTDNTDTSQNGILKKTKSNEGRLNNGNGLNDRTSLYEAIRKNLPETNMMMHTKKGQHQEKISMNQSKDWSVTGRISPQQGKPLEAKKNVTKPSVASSDDSVLLTAATVAAIARPRPPSPERKKVRTKTFQNSPSSSPSSSPTALASSSSTRTTTVATITNKKAEVFPSTSEKNEPSNLNKPRPRSRSTSPIKSGTFAAYIPASQLTAFSTVPTSSSSSSSFLSRGRSTNRRSTVDPITPHTNKLTTKLFDHDQQQRRSRSVSSTPGLPSYAAATTTSLAKQTNQIKDHKEEHSTNSSRRNSYHKSHLINATTNNATASNAIIKSSQNVRGQGQQKNVTAAVIPKNKNRIIDSHPSRNKNDPRPKQNTPLKNAITSIKTSCVTATSPLSSLSLSTSTSSVPQTTQFSSISSQVRKSTAKQNNVKEIKAKLEKGSSTTKSDARMGHHHNKHIFKSSEFAAGTSKREETNFSSSSFSSSSSPNTNKTAAATLFTRSRPKTKKNERIIPSIIMSEYVDEENKDGKKTLVASNTHSLFTPLQFVEPLEPTCDIEEGSRLELKVRAKGAEAVIWVRENKIIPNAPPDFQYFQEKASDLYGVRIADVFLEDSGLYICEAYGAGGSEKSCWCQVNVFESSSTNEDDDFDISWEDLNMSEEIRSPQPLVVPVIVTSQAEQESEPSPPFETTMAKEMPPIRTVKVKQVDKQESDKQFSNESLSGILKNRQDSTDYNRHTSSKPSHKKSSMNESAFTKSFAGAKQIDDTAVQGTSNVSRIISKMISHSAAASFPSSKVTKADYIATNEGIAGETVTEFASVNVTRETRFTYPDEIKNDPITDATTVAVIVPAESDHLTQGDIHEDNDHHHHQQFESGKRKLISELSSASDESIYLKEPRSGDEGVLSSAEDHSASISFDVKDSVANDEDIPMMCTSADSPPPYVGSPCSDQNGRSSSVDSAIGFLGRPLFVDGKFPPRILVGPSNIIALYDETVHLRVKVQNYGIPKTAVNWFKFVNGTYKKVELNSGDQSSSQGEAHISITNDGTSLCTLSITHINYDDCGRYRVKVQNLLGMDSHDCLLTVEGPPEAPGTPPKVKYDDKSKSILIQWSSCPYDGGSKITGYYVETSVVQGSKTAINRDDTDNWQLLTPQSYSWLCYTLTNPKRGSVYRFRVFGENSYGKGKPTEPSLPLLVPVLMEGRRAGSSDALLWSQKTLSPDEKSLRSDSSRKLLREQQLGSTNVVDSSIAQEEEPIEYKNVKVIRDSFYNVYEKRDELGKGRFGVVFEVVHKVSKKSYAGKIVKCIKAKDKERVQLEVKIMNDLGYHPKLICLIDAFEMPREIVIVTQRIDGGELFERVVADDFTLTEGDCIIFLRQICDAVRFIHAKNIMHLDLKPENILCTSKESNLIKIIDFGLAQYYDSTEPIRVLFGTAEFVSPEIINYEPIAPSTDNWSIGVITYILLSGLSPFMGDNDNETFSNITRAEFDFDDEAFEKVSDDAKDFITSLIVKRPEKRMTAEQSLSHRWLKQESVDCKKDVILSTDKLKRFLVRRKWQKTGNAIRALSRMTTLYSRRSSSASSTTPTGSLSLSSPPPPSYRSGASTLHESTDDNVFFPQAATSPDNNLNLNNNINQPVVNHLHQEDVKSQSLINATTSPRSKFADPARSDSGICDVGSFSSSLNYD